MKKGKNIAFSQYSLRKNGTTNAAIAIAIQNNILSSFKGNVS
jgi:hypothetical protein